MVEAFEHIISSKKFYSLYFFSFNIWKITILKIVFQAQFNFTQIL